MIEVTQTVQKNSISRKFQNSAPQFHSSREKCYLQRIARFYDYPILIFIFSLYEGVMVLYYIKNYFQIFHKISAFETFERIIELD